MSLATIACWRNASDGILDILFGKGPTLFCSRGRVVNTSQINQVKRNIRNNNENNRNILKTEAETNPRTLAYQKSTPVLRGNNPIKPNKNIKDDKKRPLSSIKQSPDDEIMLYLFRAKIPESTHQNHTTWMIYLLKGLNQLKNLKKISKWWAFRYYFNDNIKAVKNITKESPTLPDLLKGAKVIHRYNLFLHNNFWVFLVNPFLYHQAFHSNCLILILIGHFHSYNYLILLHDFLYILNLYVWLLNLIDYLYIFYHFLFRLLIDQKWIS